MRKKIQMWAIAGLAVGVSGCQFDGGPLITEDTEHSVHFGKPVEDAQQLSLQVKQALRRAPQTAVSQIQVSTVSEDTVKLSGFVDNDAVRFEAERVAGEVSGVRFVVNSLIVR